MYPKVIVRILNGIFLFADPCECNENENFTRSVLLQNGVHTDTGLYSATILLAYAPKNRYVRTGKMICE